VKIQVAGRKFDQGMRQLAIDGALGEAADVATLSDGAEERRSYTTGQFVGGQCHPRISGS
jgi:hypothetical protein